MTISRWKRLILCCSSTFADEVPLTFSNDLIELTKTLEGISEEDAQGYFRLSGRYL